MPRTYKYQVEAKLNECANGPSDECTRYLDITTLEKTQGRWYVGIKAVGYSMRWFLGETLAEAMIEVQKTLNLQAARG